MKTFKKLAIILLTVGMLISLLAGCGSSDKKDGNKLTISIFTGGYGEDIWKKTIDMFKQKFPDVEVIAELSPNNHETLRTKFLDGTPPDLYFAAASAFDNFKVVEEGVLMPLDDLLDSELESGKKFKDLFIPSILEGLKIDGKNYLMPFDIIVFGQFYDKHFFESNGWAKPENLDQLLMIGEQMKEKQVAPFTYTGIHPYYLSWTLVPTIGSVGGDELLRRIENLEKGAWSDPAVLEVLNRLELLRDKGFIQDSVLALDHTQAQMEFINHRAATVVSGTWIENEMKGNWPDEFQLKFLGNPWNKPEEKHYVSIATSTMGIPVDAKNPEMAKEFLKVMFNEENMELWAKEVGVVRPIQDNNRYKDYLSESLIDAINSLNDPNVATYYQLFTDKYAEVSKTLGDSLNGLISGTMTAEQVSEKMEEVTAKTRESRS